MKKQISIFWFRRDLRLNDNHGFSEALNSGDEILPIFIFDSDILDKLSKDDHRVTFIHNQITEMNNELKKSGKSIGMYFGKPKDVFGQLEKEYEINSVYTNHDYETYAKKRDSEISNFLDSFDIDFKTFKDQVIFEKDEIIKDDGKPYVVYTPYMNKWRKTLKKEKDLKEYKCNLKNLINEKLPKLKLSDIGFKESKLEMPKYNISSSILDNYGADRDFPYKNGTSHIGTALRFGTISIRQAFKKALDAKDKTFSNELIWREFFMQILWHFPHTRNQAFREKYDYIKWNNDKSDFEAWKKGETGYPIVDAGMRELNNTGYMHNRVRMIVASFLCKHLLIDWRWGEEYFSEKLFDYEMSSNVGNWQWSAGSGVDAAPYFRIFNPETQMKKFDANHEYVNKWLPEYKNNKDYILPIVEHKKARERALEVYRDAVGGFEG